MGRLFVGGLYDKLKDATDRMSNNPPRGDDSKLKRQLGVDDER